MKVLSPLFRQYAQIRKRRVRFLGDRNIINRINRRLMDDGDTLTVLGEILGHQETITDALGDLWPNNDNPF